ncbi:MAG TPA: HD domain-containing protein [Geobacteraceae bacterium]
MKSVSTFLKRLFPAPCHGRLFLVGGIVRDFQLGKESQDIDLAAALPADHFVSLGFRLVEGKSTAPIYFKHHHEYGKIEVILLPDTAALAEDLFRRDFTCNAMAMSLAGELIDPLGGSGDLQRRQLRACTPNSFRDDPVRIFRAFRFEAEGWQLTRETAALIRENSWDEAFRRIPVERFSREMLKALEKGDPGRFFTRMVEFDVGTAVLPEVFRMQHIPAGPAEHHPEGDLLTHSIQVLQRIAAQTPDGMARFCAMFHDIGKLATEPALYPKHHGHDEAGFKMASELCNRLCLSAAHRKALAWTSRLHIKANRWRELRDSTRIRIAEQAVKGGVTEILPLVAAADKPGTGGMAGWHDTVRVVRMTTLQLGIDQERLLAMAPEERPQFILQKQVESLRRLTLNHTRKTK